MARGSSLQSYIRHLKWALSGPCRHGICEHRGATRYKRQASCRKSYRRYTVRGSSGLPWWAINLYARAGVGLFFTGYRV